jgi:hypothetical protein
VPSQTGSAARAQGGDQQIAAIEGAAPLQQESCASSTGSNVSASGVSAAPVARQSATNTAVPTPPVVAEAAALEPVNRPAPNAGGLPLEVAAAARTGGLALFLAGLVLALSRLGHGARH